MFAFLFESVGSGEWLVLLAVILIVVGPRNLPAAARKMGQVMSKLRRAADEFKRQLMTMDEEMKKTADEIKREYIDIPEDGSTDRAITDIADEPSDEPDYGDPDDPGHISDYPEGYPDDDDYYGDDGGPDEDGGGPDAGDSGGEPVKEVAAAGGEPPAATVAEPAESTNGQDTRDTEKS